MPVPPHKVDNDSELEYAVDDDADAAAAEDDDDEYASVSEVSESLWSV
jgi:hypothetical protein